MRANTFGFGSRRQRKNFLAALKALNERELESSPAENQLDIFGHLVIFAD
jgi:hypothetical protein